MPDVLGRASLNEREAYANFLEALRIAESAAKQLALYTERKEWILISNLIGSTREKTLGLAVSSLR
jgi:hypothetical protein